MTNKTHEKIIRAVADGAANTRQIAKQTGLRYGQIGHYFYGTSAKVRRFKNGDLLTWAPGKANTICLGPRAAVHRDPQGRIIAVGRAELI